MSAEFPWPVTDDELLLNQALEDVVAACETRGNHETGYLREAAGKHIDQR